MSFLAEEAVMGLILMWTVVPFLANLSAISLPSTPTWGGIHWNTIILFRIFSCWIRCLLSCIRVERGLLFEDIAWQLYNVYSAKCQIPDLCQLELIFLTFIILEINSLTFQLSVNPVLMLWVVTHLNSTTYLNYLSELGNIADYGKKFFLKCTQVI